MKLLPLTCLTVFMICICHAENAIDKERNDMEPAMNQREVDDSGLGKEVKTRYFPGKNSNFYGVS